MPANVHTWTGWDGSVWDLSGGTQGVVLQAGARGLHMPPIQRYSTKAPAVAGSLYRGAVVDERDAFWLLKIFASSNWLALNRAFWATLRPDKLGRWTVTQPGGEQRWLDLRFTGLADDAEDIDPQLLGWAPYGVNLIAEQPYWSKTLPVQSFTSTSDNANFYGGPGGGGFGPPFYIASGLSVSTATITNPGDVDSWPVWTVRGPSTSVTVGVAGRTITFPMTLNSGQWVRIDTAPTDQVAYDQDGLRRDAELTADFAEIPAGVDVPLQITIAGGGSVDLALTARYFQAY